ncbi:MAG TPA: regulatory iron-sulfur-containing complex subunit RicT [Candidatus Sabulitectum sp.]|nr:regulatory iron-sulfur-containing complex subunit RicT [Candidatus Sabulitectum sp.]HPF32515.1 regulatory iron-sulfur-containing complex subunit RicT [Candidatus Sabulitectum sp.]HPJ27613.1 regulatory iron-sulfur-containing complex subunit RicT [Candidatus Sabulitectum sp.]HPR21411.1 regulatory iron-sulfur-containing complex subunit RicT [Candidatus Sabulitectum sp.]
MTHGNTGDRQPFEVLQLAFKSRRLAFFSNETSVPVDIGRFAVVSVDRGEDMGRVVAKLDPSEVKPEDIEGRYLRYPCKEDTAAYQANLEFEKEVLDHCEKRVRARNLEMRLTDCEVQLDRNRIRIFFTADQRTDFRGLVRDMASAFRARIEMRQIGVRDDAKHKDGVGICGRRLCCAGFLNDFKSVTLKSVRDQGLSPNPSKVSGSCSRLMCCLEYETDFYRKARKTFPREGTRLKLAGLPAEVKSCDIFRENVFVTYEDGREEQLEIEEFHRRRTMQAPPPEPVPQVEEKPPAPEPSRERETGAEKETPAKKTGRGRRRHRRSKSRKEERKS